MYLQVRDGLFGNYARGKDWLIIEPSNLVTDPVVLGLGIGRDILLDLFSLSTYLESDSPATMKSVMVSCRGLGLETNIVLHPQDSRPFSDTTS